ncbi:hypothetical protein [Nostoc sp.]|uniref:hypothetical protein n=1 Tax=Nostoc sp. TaxID=1180 RepID=UPI002FF47C05
MLDRLRLQLLFELRILALQGRGVCQYGATGAGKVKDSASAGTLIQHNNNGLDDLAKWSKEVSSGIKAPPSIDPDKLQNKDVVTELQKINSNLTAIATRPSAINVTSATPVSDAADIYSNISKNAVRNANL